MNTQTLWDCIGDATHSVLELLVEKADLVSLSLINKATHSLVEPYLYSDFEQSWHGFKGDASLKLIPLLRTLQEKPGLGIHVRRLAFLGTGTHLDGDNVPNISQTDLAKLDLKKAELFIDHAGHIPLVSQWKKELRSGVMDALVTLLIAQVPRLRHLKMELNFTKQTKLLGLFLMGLLCERKRSFSSLNCLESVQHTYWKPDIYRRLQGRNTADVLPFFYLQSVRHLSVALDNPEIFSWPLATLPNAGNITTLHLSLVRESHLHHILSRTSSVRKLTWTWYYNPDDQHSTNRPYIDLVALTSSLNHIKMTLEELVIEGDDCAELAYCHPYIELKGSLQGISSLPCLRKLDVGVVMLMGGWSLISAASSLEQTLPRQLQTLHINDSLEDHTLTFQEDNQNTWEPEDIVSIFQSWSKHWVTTHGDLELISYAGDIWTDETADVLLALGNSRGTKVVIDCLHGDGSIMKRREN